MESVKVSFGKAVRALRTAKGLSQDKFALQIDMDRTYLASVEAGKRNIALLNIQKIAEGWEYPLRTCLLLWRIARIIYDKLS